MAYTKWTLILITIKCVLTHHEKTNNLHTRKESIATDPTLEFHEVNNEIIPRIFKSKHYKVDIIIPVGYLQLGRTSINSKNIKKFKSRYFKIPTYNIFNIFIRCNLTFQAVILNGAFAMCIQPWDPNEATAFRL